jgi:cytoplasmic iron level regulating protein YaaA (DUF328/UPF0246 family)
MPVKLLLLLSPAKNLARDPITKGTATQPIFKKEIDILIDTLKIYSMGDISKLMGISTKLAKLNYDRYQNFNPEQFNKGNASQALFTFNGQVYEKIDAASLSDSSLQYLQNHLYILSGLYGLLRTSDWMQPYRLEMGTKLKVNSCTNLYEFWKETLTKKLNTLIKKEGFTHIVNCASIEYAGAVNFNALDIPVITCQFKDFKNDQYKTIGIYAKKARGLMVRYLAEKNVTSLKGLQAFNTEGYQFSKEASTSEQYVFLRKV